MKARHWTIEEIVERSPVKESPFNGVIAQVVYNMQESGLIVITETGEVVPIPASRTIH